MELTNTSKTLLRFCEKNNCIIETHPNATTIRILKELYNHIKTGINHINILRNKYGEKWLSISHNKNNSSVVKALTFDDNSYPNPIKTAITTSVKHHLTYRVELFEKPIEIIFAIENISITNKLLEKYNNYFEWMLVWLYIAHQYSSKKCFTTLRVLIYHLSLEKKMPHVHTDILGQNHVNTAFTYSCPTQSPEIIIYRQEEWFKVFIHETFHTLGLDFSNMNTDGCAAKMRKIFPVKTDVNLYESYCETWARIINSLFCSYIYRKSPTIHHFIENFRYFIHMEQMFSLFQMVKVLSHMNLSYTDLYSTSSLKKSYKEDSNILAYYVITYIFIYNYEEFINWCSINNTSLLNFTKTSANINRFCSVITSNYKTQKLLESVSCGEVLFENHKNIGNKLTNTLRMTSAELG